jgi:acetolactate synthase-1/2/3 large subunit
MQNSDQVDKLSEAINTLNIPTYVSGMARGLLSKLELPIYRHARKQALQEADLVILAGVPCDFRVDYGRHINNQAKIVSINLSSEDLYMNRKPTLGILINPRAFLINLSQSYKQNNWENWHKILLDRDLQRNDEISRKSEDKTEFVNPLKICLAINRQIQKEDHIVADGGDFVATASYILQPRSLTGWLDPGVFGTLGVGAGFVMGAQLTHPKSVVWAIYGDGAFGYSLIEFDTFVRHKIPVIAIIGNDASWSQIARGQVDILQDPISTNLEQTQYHNAVIALGGVGLIIENEDEIEPVLKKARKYAESGNPVAVNVIIGETDFRKGSMSI